MNIIFISREPYPFGMAGTKRVRLFAEYFVKNNCKVNVFINNRHNGDNSSVGYHNNIKYTLIKYSGIKWFINILKMYSILRNNFMPDIKNLLFIYDNLGITNFQYIIIGKIIGYKIVNDIIEDRSTLKENIRFRRKIHLKLNIYLENYLLLLVDGIIVISKSLENKYMSKSKIPIKLIPVSATNLLQDVNNNRKDKLFRFTYSGSFGNKDGIIYLIEAFRMLKKQFNDIELALSGKMKRKSVNNFDKLIKEIGINYYGYLPDKKFYKFLSSSDTLIMPRVNTKHANSGFPFKLGEYLATGKPVIASKVSDINIYLTDKVNSILVEPSSIQALHKAMKYVLLNKLKCANIGENGKKVAMKYFNPEINGNLLKELFEQI